MPPMFLRNPRTPARLALLGLIAAFVALALCCGARAGEVVARIPAVVEVMGDGTTRVVLDLPGRLPGDDAPPPSAPPSPEPQEPETMGRALDGALAGIPRDWRPTVLGVLQIEADRAIAEGLAGEPLAVVVGTVAVRAVQGLGPKAAEALGESVAAAAGAMYADDPAVPPGKRLAEFARLVQERRAPK